MFAEPGAPVMDFVFTVCDDAAGEACPVWPGQPMTAHWGIEDPAKVEGTDIEKEAAFVQAFKLPQEPHLASSLNLPHQNRSTRSRSAPAPRHRRDGRRDRTSPARQGVELTPRPTIFSRRLAAEALGTAFLVATVVGSGIMAETAHRRNVALALLGNTLPTGAILVVLITIFGPISGAHFNPAVSLVFALRRELGARDARLYVAAQIVGGIAGTFAAHLMFELPLLELSPKVRTGRRAMVRRVGRDLRPRRDDPRPASASSARPFPGWSGSTSPPPTGSPPRPPSPIPP